MVAQYIAFGIIAAVMVVSALRVVTSQNIVHAALYLVMVLAGVAAIFILLGAEYLGSTQVLVYIGAIVVLFLFGIMLTRKALLDDAEELDNDNRIIAVLVALLMFAVMVYALVDTFEDTELENLSPTTTDALSDVVFGPFIVPFLATSVLLLAALIGAIVVARRD